jgi:hypothetical protein
MSNKAAGAARDNGGDCSFLRRENTLGCRENDNSPASLYSLDPRSFLGSVAFDFPFPSENRLKGTAVAERPQERLETFGAGALSDTELLAMLLRSGTQGQDVLTLAGRLIAEGGSLGGLIAWREADFRRLKGIGRVKALQLVAVMEVARRVLGTPAGESPLLTRADLIAAYLQPWVAGLEVEKLCYMAFIVGASATMDKGC